MTRDRIPKADDLEARARAAFEGADYHAVTLPDLLGRAGLSHLPRRFRSKAHLYTLVMGKPPPPSKRAGIASAAAIVFDRLGYFSATVKEVAKAARLSPVALTTAYPDKAALWRAATGLAPPPGALSKGWGGARLIQASMTRDRAMASAKALFEQQRYDAVGVRAVAKAAGLSTGAIMGHFPTKADLWRAAMQCEPPLDGELTRRAPELFEALEALLAHEPVGAPRRAKADWRRARRLVDTIKALGDGG